MKQQEGLQAVGQNVFLSEISEKMSNKVIEKRILYIYVYIYKKLYLKCRQESS